MSTESLSDLKKWVGEVIRQSTDGEFVGLNRVVDMVSKNFSVQPHEVAILVITEDDRFLRFVVPEKLRQVGQIPLTSTNSLAARTVREKRPEVINHFAVVPHSSVFEAVPITEDERGEAIQKIMSVPILQERKVAAVIQISRKGKTAADAGPDFTTSQLRELKLVADTLAPWSRSSASNNYLCSAAHTLTPRSTASRTQAETFSLRLCSTQWRQLRADLPPSLIRSAGLEPAFEPSAAGLRRHPWSCRAAIGAPGASDERRTTGRMARKQWNGRALGALALGILLCGVPALAQQDQQNPPAPPDQPATQPQTQQDQGAPPQPDQQMQQDQQSQQQDQQPRQGQSAQPQQNQQDQPDQQAPPPDQSLPSAPQYQQPAPPPQNFRVRPANLPTR